MESRFDKEQREHILRYLEQQGVLWAGYVFCREDGDHLKELGHGNFASVYEMYLSDIPEVRSAVKVIGFDDDLGNAGHASIKNEIRLQRQAAAVCRGVTEIEATETISILYDDELQLRLPDAQMQEETEQDWSLLQLTFIRMQLLRPVLKKKAGKVELTVPGLGTEERETLRLAEHIAEALCAAHDKKIIHRDVKLENIFYDAKYDVYKLGDFGIARYIDGGTVRTKAFTGGYGAPEISNGEEYDQTADMYSLGITLYLLANHLCYPFSDQYRVNKREQYREGAVLPAPSNASKAFGNLIHKMCAFWPEQRYRTMKQVLEEIRKLRSLGALPKEQEEKRAPAAPLDAGESTEVIGDVAVSVYE